jgi:hypothetical protein
VKQFDYNSYLKNNPLLKEDTSVILFEQNKVDSIIKKLDTIATSRGFKRVKTSKDKTGIYYLAKWTRNKYGNEVELYHNGDLKNLQIIFDDSAGSPKKDPVSNWLKKSTWDKYDAYSKDDYEDTIKDTKDKTKWNLKQAKQSFDKQRDKNVSLTDNLAYFVYDNFSKISGLSKSQRKKEGHFPNEIQNFVDQYLEDGVYDDNFLQAYSML